MFLNPRAGRWAHGCRFNLTETPLENPYTSGQHAKGQSCRFQKPFTPEKSHFENFPLAHSMFKIDRSLFFQPSC
jgi:hypothetical protein